LGLALSCNGFDKRTYNGGTCAQTDTQLDALRYQAASKFSKTLLGMGAQTTGCLDYQNLREQFSYSLALNAVTRVSHGFGVYTGLDHITEYFSLLSPLITHRFIRLTAVPNGEQAAYVSAGGGTFIVGKEVSNRYLESTFTRNEKDYLETKFQFNGCDTRASSLTFPSRSEIFQNRKTGVSSLAEMLFHVANGEMLGIRSICLQHQQFCAPPLNYQFSGMTECLERLRLLPLDSQCGKGAIVSGNTVVCRAKHQFMVQIDPVTHCPHLGMRSQACSDSNCEEPGLPEDVDTTFPTANPNLSSALYDINTKFKALETPLEYGAYFAINPYWKYAAYCQILKHYVKIQIPGTGKILSLTEVNIIGAKAVAVTASSAGWGRDPNLIINGQINGDWGSGDVTHTDGEADPWVMIELAPGGNVEEIIVYGRTDCCKERMAGAVATLHNQNSLTRAVRTSPLRLTDSGTQRYSAFGKKFLKLTGPGNNHMGLTEVVVSGVSVTASSNFDGKDPNILLNGRINGDMASNEVYNTNANTIPWVKIQLSESVNPRDVLIYGRTDCCQDRMNGIIASVEYGKCS
jgi:hypothetical protein